MVPVTEREIFLSKDQYNLPKLPLGGKQSNSVENHTIVIKAMCDLMTDYHADATIVERFSLAFAEERWLEDTCREHWRQGKTNKIKNKIGLFLQNYTKHRMLNNCMHACLKLNVFACTCENTYLVFAGWVEGIDNSSSSYPPGEDKEGGIKQYTVRSIIVQHNSKRDIKINLRLITTG